MPNPLVLLALPLPLDALMGGAAGVPLALAAAAVCVAQGALLPACDAGPLPPAIAEGARPTEGAEEIGLQALAFLEPAIGPEARRKRRAMRLTCQALTGLYPTAAQGKLTITANGRLLFQLLSNGWQGIHAPRAFTKIRLPDMLAWIGAALQEGGPAQHGPRLQPALAYQAIRPEGSRHALLAAIDDAQSALREAGLDPTGWFTDPRR